MNLRFVLTNENRVFGFTYGSLKYPTTFPGRAQAWMAMRLIVTGLGLWRRAVGALGAMPVKQLVVDAVYVQRFELKDCMVKNETSSEFDLILNIWNDLKHSESSPVLLE